jgi:hypothetical protein
MIYAKDIDFFTKFSELSFQDVHFLGHAHLVSTVTETSRYTYLQYYSNKMTNLYPVSYLNCNLTSSDMYELTFICIFM